MIEEMAHRDPERAEYAFHALLPIAGEHVPELADALATEQRQGVCAWLCELLASTGTEDGAHAIAARLSDEREHVRTCAEAWLERMDTKTARTLHDEHRRSV